MMQSTSRAAWDQFGPLSSVRCQFQSNAIGALRQALPFASAAVFCASTAACSASSALALSSSNDFSVLPSLTPKAFLVMLRLGLWLTRLRRRYRDSTFCVNQRRLRWHDI